MANKFKNIFLVCLDYGDDLNYVVARNPSLKKARHAANVAKQKWPDKEVYITVEKTFEEDLENSIPTSIEKKKEKQSCNCGAPEGGCISNLSCRCPAIAKCKQMKLDDDSFNKFYGTNNLPTSELETAEINVVNIRRGIVEVVIPDWDPEETIGLSPGEIPQEVMEHLEPGVVLEADINFDAATAENLVLDNLRLVYEDDEDDEDSFEESGQSNFFLTNSLMQRKTLSQDIYAPLPGGFGSNPLGDEDYTDFDDDDDDQDDEDDDDFEEDGEENSGIEG